MSRLIFTDPIEFTELDKNVIGLIFDMTDYHYPNEKHTGITEQRLADVYKIERRDIRKIVERWNFNKFLKVDSTQKIKVINGKYRIVDKELAERVYKFHLDNLRSAAMKHKIMAKALGIDLTNMTMAELLEVQ